MTDRQLRDFIPFIDIRDNCIVSKRGDLTFGWKLTLPVAYSVNAAGYDSIISSFMQAYRILPPYCVVHKQDVFCFDIYHAQMCGEFLSDSYERHFDGRPYLNGHCYLYLTFSTRSVIEVQSYGSGAYRKLSARVPDRQTIESAVSYASQFASILRNNQLLLVDDMSDGDFLRMDTDGSDAGTVADYLRMYSDTRSLDYPLELYPDRIVCGDSVMRCWYIQDSDAYPPQVSSVVHQSRMSSLSSEIYLSGGSPFGYSLRIPHIVNRYVITLPTKAVESELTQRKKMMTSMSLYSSGCRVNSEELEDYLYRSAQDGVTTIKCFTDVFAWGRESDMPDIRNGIVAAFADLNMQICEERRAAPALFYAGIPGAAAELGSDYHMTSELNAFLCHGLWDGYNNGMIGGELKISDRNRMIPVTIDIQSVAREKNLIDNMNAVVIGPSGSGKSFLMNHLINNFYRASAHTLVIDVGDSYRGITAVINEETGGRDGIYNTYDPEHPFCFNPFRGRKKWNDVGSDGERLGSGLDFVMSLVQTMYEPKEGWTKQASGILTELFESFFRYWDGEPLESLEDNLREAFINSRRERAEKTRRRFDEKEVVLGWKSPLCDVFPADRMDSDPLFDDFYNYVTRVVSPLVNDENYMIDGVRIRKDMFDIDSFGVALGKYGRNGKYGYFLNASEQNDLFRSRLTVFEVDRIKDNTDLFPLWILCIMHEFEDKMRSLPCQKVIVIEEAWSAIARPSMARFITWMWRTARKFRTSAMVVTQQLQDLMASDIIKDAIVQNSSVKILLDQSKNANNFEDSARLLSLSSTDIGKVLSLNRDLDPSYRYKEAFFSIGEKYSDVFAVEVSLEQALAFESDKTKKRRVFDKATETGSFIAAIKEVAAEIRSGGSNTPN